MAYAIIKTGGRQYRVAEGETIDVSLNGALVTTPHAIPVGSLVEISLYLFAGGKPVVGLGTIVRVSSNNQMGILLDRLPPAESGRLQDFLLPKIEDRYPANNPI